MAKDELVWRPSKKQAMFLSLPYSIKEGAYAGGAGSGKTDLLLLYGIVHKFHEHPEFKQLFLRRTYPEIRDEVIPRSRKYYQHFGAKQTLLKRVGGGRVAAWEIMVANPAIRNLIREDKIAQMYSAIQTGQNMGMQTLVQALDGLVSRGVITRQKASRRAVDKKQFQ